MLWGALLYAICSRFIIYLYLFILSSVEFVGGSVVLLLAFVMVKVVQHEYKEKCDIVPNIYTLYGGIFMTQAWKWLLIFFWMGGFLCSMLRLFSYREMAWYCGLMSDFLFLCGLRCSIYSHDWCNSGIEPFNLSCLKFSSGGITFLSHHLLTSFQVQYLTLSDCKTTRYEL